MFLYVCSTENDYLQDLTFAGLAEVLGPGHLTVCPPHWQYRRGKRHFWSLKQEYPRNLGLLPSGTPGTEATVDEVKSGLGRNEFQAVFLASAKPDALETLLELMPLVRVPWIFLDGGDRRPVGGDFERLGGVEAFRRFQDLCRRKSPGLVFKREMEPGSREERLFPLQFSAHTGQIQPVETGAPKTRQVVFWAVESSPVRKKAFQLLDGKYDCRQNGSMPGQTFRKYGRRGADYFRALQESRICLSLRGEGFDTLRFWEVPACGSLLLSDPPDIQIPRNFIHRASAVFCKNDLSDLLELIDYYLAHEKEAEQIAREGQKHVLRYHTHIKRAEYVMEVLADQLGIRAG